MIRVVTAGAILAGFLTCGGDRPNPYVQLVKSPTAEGVRLILEPAPGTRINARLQPALELPDSTIHRFDSPWLTPDSSYYTRPPELVLPEAPRGLIRASVCPEGESVCRLVTIVMR